MDEIDERQKDRGYPEIDLEMLQLIWGEGFLSPGGPAEVARIVSGKNIAGCKVLDIGSGAGGVAVALVQEHGAGEVIGIDIEQHIIDFASRRARQLHLEDRIKYQLVEPGVFPFADNSFDIVFSKDMLLHVRDKEVLCAEALRVLCPGGQILISDWLRGDGESFTPVLDNLSVASRQNYHFASLRELGELLARLGFTEIELEDRREWYQSEARTELKRIQGPLKAKLLQLVGEEVTQGVINFWEKMIAALDLGAFRPGHVRAIKPTDVP